MAKKFTDEAPRLIKTCGNLHMAHVEIQWPRLRAAVASGMLNSVNHPFHVRKKGCQRCVDLASRRLYAEMAIRIVMHWSEHKRY